MPLRARGIYIPVNVASSKNSKQWTGERLVNSKVVNRYKQSTKNGYWLLKPTFLKMIQGHPRPLRLGFYFIRATHQRFDYLNAGQLPLDLMQEYGWIADDCASEVVPVFLGYHVDKSDAGMIITIENS